MTNAGSAWADSGDEAVSDRLADLVSIEARIVDSLDRWGDAVRDHPEAAATIARMRSTSRSHRDALERRLDAISGQDGGRASEPLPSLAPPSSASEALQSAAGVAAAAAFACETAYQTARLASDGDTCDLLEIHLSGHAATVVDARRALPHTVARELRGRGVTCACRCPMCSIGACGCIRATLSTAESAWSGPARESGLTLLSPPRPGSQLAEAGLEEGDRILSIDGEEVGWNVDVQTALCRHEVGQEARLTVERRSGERADVLVRREG